MTQDPAKLSVVIITKNEAHNIAPCIAGVAFADEVLVVDSESEDGTVEIAREKGARILQQPWLGYGAQKNAGMAACSHDRILFLDADERVDDELAEAIRGADFERFAAFEMNRKNYFYTHWMRSKSPDWVIRLIDRTRGRYNERLVHESIEVDGAVGRLPGWLEHYSYRSLADYLARLNRYTTLGARQALARGRVQSRWTPFLRFPFEFTKRWLVQGGIRDGWVGMLYALLSTFQVLVKYLKVWEFQQGLVAVEKEEESDAKDPGLSQ